MRIPSTKNIGDFADDIYSKCNASRQKRVERDSAYKRLFLNGSMGSDISTYNCTYAFIDNLSSYLYSPVELRFNIDTYGFSGIIERAKMRSAAAEHYKHIRRSGLDTTVEDAVTWALVKGKTFVKLLWSSEGLKPYLIQPGAMGVLEENLDNLDDQDAFSHTTFITPDRLYRVLSTHPDRDKLMQKARKYALSAGTGAIDSEEATTLRNIVAGGIQPYQVSGQQNTQFMGQLQWLDVPAPTLSADVATELMPFKELWVWDDDRNEYTTIQFIGRDVVISGEYTHRNLFSEQLDWDNKEKRTYPSEENPLAGQHPFREICPNKLDGYFWGRSELCNVAMLQESINKRIIGINQLLRRQEDPPKFFSGVAGIKQQAYSIMKKAGGYFADSNPNAKVQDMYPQTPDGLFESLHEFEAMFDKMAGFTPTLAGRGEMGVRSQAQAETLVRTASPRFKDRALIVERQVESVGALALDLLKAKSAETLVAWVPEKAIPPAMKVASNMAYEEPPAKGMVPVNFTFYDLPDNCKITVDSHSSSPAFSQEAKQDLLMLLKAGAINEETLLDRMHPAGADSMIEDLMRMKAERAEMLEKNPELAKKLVGKKK